MKDYKGAIEDYSEVIKLNPNSRDAFFNRSLSKNELKDVTGAIEDITKVINLNNKKKIAPNIAIINGIRKKE